MTPDPLVAALQQLWQQLMDKSDELHAEARKMKHFASQEYCDGKARGLQFSAQELSALLGRIHEEPPQWVQARRQLGWPEGTYTTGEGANSSTAPPLGADAPKDEHDPLCSIGTQAGDQTMPCDCQPPVNGDALSAILQQLEKAITLRSWYEAGEARRQLSAFVAAPSPAPPQAPAGWQPIETAPKDGTRILLWWPNECDTAMAGCWHRRGNGHWFSDVGDCETEGAPTHWMPLPVPPLSAPVPETP